jgi:hypothetical protein
MVHVIDSAVYMSGHGGNEHVTVEAVSVILCTLQVILIHLNPMPLLHKDFCSNPGEITLFSITFILYSSQKPMNC